MKIEMLNVGFGEFIKLTDEEKILIVDCGTKNRKDKYFPLVQTELDSLNIFSCMISHFDIDHYNLLEKYAPDKNRISNLYIPRLTFVKDRNINLEYAVALEVINRKSTILRINSNFASQLRALSSMGKSLLSIIDFVLSISYYENIVFLNRGDTFCIGSNYSVLWPPASKNSEFCNDGNIFEDPVLDFFYNNFEDDIREIEKIFIDFYNRELGYLYDNNFKSTDKTINHIEPKFFERRIYSIIDKIVEKFSGTKIGSFLNNHCLYPKHFIENFEKSMNNTSIVFQNAQESKYNILFTGDVEVSTLKSIRKDIVRDYHVVKVPHHGTKGHFKNDYSCLPKSENYLISNGDYSNWGVGSGIKLLNNNADIQCTCGKHCQVLNTNFFSLTCKNSYCLRNCFNEKIEKNY